MTYKVIALARLVCPRANIPSTTALATLNTRSGRELGLVRGANVVMPNLTPAAVSRPLRDLPRQGLHPRDGRGVPRVHERRIESIGRTSAAAAAIRPTAAPGARRLDAGRLHAAERAASATQAHRTSESMRMSWQLTEHREAERQRGATSSTSRACTACSSGRPTRPRSAT